MTWQNGVDPGSQASSWVDQNLCGQVDETVVDYIKGYLIDFFDGRSDEDDEDVLQVIRPMLEGQASDEAIENLCQKVRSLANDQRNSHGHLQGNGHAFDSGASTSNGLTRLDKVIEMRRDDALSKTGAFDRSVDVSSMGKRLDSQVNRSKLEKAEKKIAAKLEKRSIKANYEASKLLDTQKDSEKTFEEFFMQVNPLDMSSSKGKEKDVKLENFDVSYAGLRILTNANLTLAYGRRYGLVGRNGIGKSTLLRTMAHRELAIPTSISILYVEQEIVGDQTSALHAVLKADVWREHLVGEQETITSRLNRLEQLIEEEQKVADLASSGSSTSAAVARLKDERGNLSNRLIEIHTKLADMDSDTAEARAGEILHGLGFSVSDQAKKTSEFSGGWRMRLSLARALFIRPNLLMLDEPSNMLDLPAVAWLANYLKTQWTSTLLVVSHDRAFLDDVATDILHLHSERLDSYNGNFTQFYATKEERRKNQQREYDNQLEKRKHLQAFVDRWRYNANRAAQAQSKLKEIERMPHLEAPEQEHHVTFRFPPVEKLSSPILMMDDVSFGYTKDDLLFKNVNLSVQLDSRIAIVGSNGAGKTTLIKLLIGELEPRAGLVTRHGRLRMAYFSQHHVNQLEVALSPVQFMAKRYPGKSDEEYRSKLGSFGITGTTALQTIATLSGGQKSRVAFAILALQNPHILVLDEPSNHLDIESIDALIDAIRQFEGGVIYVSHDEMTIRQASKEIWNLEKGSVSRFEGTIVDYKKKVVSQT